MQQMQYLKAIGLIGLGLTLGLCAPAMAKDAGLVSTHITGPIKPVMNPESPVWKKAPPFKVTLQPQVMTTPTHPKPAITSMTVRSLNSASGWVAFLLEWKDASKDEVARTGKWVDAIAMEFPMDPKNLPAPMMGHRDGGRVNILQWRADWQRDVDRGGTISVKEIYPNAVLDTKAEDIYKGTDQVAFNTARAIGNVQALAKHKTSVQDLMAEGYGSLTPKPIQSATGKGVWKNGTWKVVIARPIEAVGDADSAPFAAGGTTQVGFAAWNGSVGERGSRKSWAAWFPMTLK
jgi:DMSO reductase family type II enzyme heme b subunit